MPREIEVLHIEDNQSFADLVSDYIGIHYEHIKIQTLYDPDSALEFIQKGDVDCVVSDYNLPGTNGIEILQKIRETDSEIPFILFTGKGSEEVASDTISSGGTDYLQKGGGTEKYDILANRITNYADQYFTNQSLKKRTKQLQRREEQLKQKNSVLETLIDSLPVGILVEGTDGEILHANEQLLDIISSELCPMDILGRDCSKVAEEVKGSFANPERFIKRAATLLESGEPVIGERIELSDRRIIRRDFIPYSRPNRQANLWMFRDITEEEVTTSSMDNLLGAVAQASEGIAVVRTDDTYDYVNTKYAEIVGYESPEELRDKKWQTIHSKKAIEKINTEVYSIVEEHGHWEGKITEVIDGEPNKYHVSITQLDNEWRLIICRP